MGSDDASDFDIHISNDEETVGVVTFTEERYEEIPKATFQVSLLRDLVEMAEMLDWGYIVMGLDDDYPVFIECDDDSNLGSLLVTPFLPDEEEDDDE